MKKLILFIFISQFCLAQKSNNLENSIYGAVDNFIANPTLSGLEDLSKIERNFYASSLPKSKQDWLALVILQCNKSYYLNQFGKSSLAIKTYEEAWLIFKKKQLSNYDIIEYCLKPLGNLYAIQGDYQSAENIIKEYYYLANTSPKNLENNSHKASALLNLSAVYQSSGKHTQVIQFIEKTALKENLTLTQKAKLLNNLGNSYLMLQQFPKAEENFKKSITVLEKHDAKSFIEISNAYRNLAQVYQQLSNFSLAEKTLLKSKTILLQSNNYNVRQLAKLEYAKALLLFQKKDIESSHQSINELFKLLIPGLKSKNFNLPSQNQLYQETILIDALDLKAKLYTLQNQPKKAQEAYKQAFYIEDLLQNDLFYEESRIVSQIKNRKRVEYFLSIQLELFKKENNQKYIHEAFEWSEKYKSAVLNYSVLKISKSASEEKKLIEKIQNLNSVIIKEQLKLEKADITKINNTIQLQNETMFQLKKIKNNNISQTINIEKLFQKLKNDKTELISYFYGKENIFVFHIKEDKILFQKLQDFNKVDTSIRKLNDYYTSAEKITNNPKEFIKSSFDVYKQIQLENLIQAKSVLIIPDGALSFIPFESLITKPISSTTNFSKMPFLIYNSKISYNHSATFYLNSKEIDIKNNTVLGLFPVFNSTTFSLPFSKEEYRFLSKNFSGEYFLENKATYKNFTNNSNKFDIIHLSTHASAGDIYEPAQIKFIDQDIAFNELYTVKTNANLVVLSACETGIGKMYQGEGFMSVARGFQMAGAQNLVFSLWKVNDFTTYKIIEKFYSNLKQNKPYSSALHNAKLDFLKDKNIPNTKKSPYYWSSLVYYGTIENETKTKDWIFGAIFISIIGVILLLINKKRIFLKH